MLADLRADPRRQPPAPTPSSPGSAATSTPSPCPGTSAESALIQLEEVRAHYAAHGVDGVDGALDASFGIAARPPARRGHRRRAAVRGRGAHARQARGVGPLRHLRRGEDDDEEQLLLPRHARPARQAVRAPRAARRPASCARRSTTSSSSTATSSDHGRLEAWTSPTAVDFVREHRNGVLVTQKRDGRPQLSNIIYAVGDDGVIRISITADRAKYKNLRRDPARVAARHPRGLLGLRRCSRPTWS